MHVTYGDISGELEFLQQTKMKLRGIPTGRNLSYPDYESLGNAPLISD